MLIAHVQSQRDRVGLAPGAAQFQAEEVGRREVGEWLSHARTVAAPLSQILAHLPLSCSQSIHSRLLLSALRALALVPLLAAICFAQEIQRPDLKLNDGTTLARARIVSISNERVMIAHRGGVVTVHPDQVPLDVLARGHMELEARATEQERILAEERALDATRKKMEVEKTGSGDDLERKVDEAGIDTEVEIQAILGRGAIVTAERGFVGPVHTKQVVKKEERQGTGLTSHKREIHQRVEVTEHRRSVALDPRGFYLMMPVGDLLPYKRVKLRVWKLYDHHFKRTDGRPDSIPVFTTDRALVALFMRPDAKLMSLDSNTEKEFEKRGIISRPREPSAKAKDTKF